MITFKKFLALVPLLFVAALSFGQNTTTCTGTVVDSDTQVWAHTYWEAKIQVPNGQKAVFTDGTLVPVYSGLLDDNGAFQVGAAVGDTSKILPFGATWKFFLHTLTSFDTVVTDNFPVTGASYDCGTKLSSLIPPIRINAGPYVYAYNTTEIKNSSNGDGYLNTINNQIYIWKDGSYVATLQGLGTMAFQNANNVNITGGSVTANLQFPNSYQPPTSTDGSNLSAAMVLSPYTFTVDPAHMCDANLNYQTNTLTGTDNRIAWNTMVKFAMLVGGSIHSPDGKTCRLTAPGGVISSFAIASNVLTVQMPNKLQVNDVVTPYCLSVGTYMNGLPLVVTSATSSQFTAQFIHADVSSVSEPGGQTTGGRGSWNPTPCPAGSKAIGSSPALTLANSMGRPANNPYVLDLSGNNSNLVVDGIGDLLDFDYDKATQVISASTDVTGNILTLNFVPLLGAHTFDVGSSITLAYTGTGMDDEWHTCTVVTTTTATCNGPAGGAHPSLSATSGVVHEPWINFGADGTQGYRIQGMQFTSFNRNANMTTGQCSVFFCNYYAGTAGIRDWRGGSGILNDVQLQGWEFAFFGLQADFENLTNIDANGNHRGLLINPYSTPFNVFNYNDFGNEGSAEIDGNGLQGVNFWGGHFRGGNSTTAQLVISNKLYDHSACCGGGATTTTVSLFGVDFEVGSDNLNPPPYFIAVDVNDNTSSLLLNTYSSSLVNSALGVPSNVPSFIGVGALHSASPVITITNPASVGHIVGSPGTGSLNQWVDNTSTANVRVLFVNGDAGNDDVPLILNRTTGIGISLGLQTKLNIASPSYTGTLSNATSGASVIAFNFQDPNITANFNWGILGKCTDSNGCIGVQNLGGTPNPFLNFYKNTTQFTGGGGTSAFQLGTNGAIQINSQNGGLLLTPPAGVGFTPAVNSDWYQDSNNLPRFKDGAGVDQVLLRVGTNSTNHAVCWKSATTIGYCSTQPDASGVCTCN